MYAELIGNYENYRIKSRQDNKLFSEINASIAACTYTTIRNSVTMVTCYDKGKLDRTLSKDWNALKFLDTHTDGGMFKLRQLSDTALVKKSGHYINERGGKIPAGWQSMIEGVVADDPQKIRGDRVDVLIFDEFGSWPKSSKAFIQAEALVAINGVRFGIKVAGGSRIKCRRKIGQKRGTLR